MGFWSGLCTCVGCVVGVGICIASAGMATPFVAASSAPLLIGGTTAAGLTVGYMADKEEMEREERLMQDQRYKDAKEEVNRQIDANNQIKGQINDIIGKINGTIPKQPNETDEYLNTQLGILTGNLRNGETRLNDLMKALDSIRKELGGVIPY